MRFIDPHVHMGSRTTDDYEAMVLAGCEAVTEPAFWAAFDRKTAMGFYDYFRQLTEVEPVRAAKYGIDHYCWLCINPKEAEDVGLAREVIALIPEFLDSPRALGIGEIGLNKNSRNEKAILEEHIDLAVQHDTLILVHTPHLEDKLKGTRYIVDALRAHGRVNPDRVIIDHCEEHTVRIPREAGMWAGLTLYPDSKCTPQRAADILETVGIERIWANSAADWGISDPLALPKLLRELRRRGHTHETVRKVAWDNPVAFLSQSPKFAPR